MHKNRNVVVPDSMNNIGICYLSVTDIISNFFHSHDYDDCKLLLDAVKLFMDCEIDKCDPIPF